MTIKGAKRNVPHLLQAQQAPICLWSISRHCHQVNCFQEDMLEFEGPMGQCFSRFPTVSSRKRGEKRKKDTGLTGRVNESK